MISKFVIVGCLGFVLQLLTLWVLTSVAHWPWLPATATAVEIAVLHNFVWHERWTWADRRSERFAMFAPFARLVRFNIATGLTSVFGNVLLMTILVGMFRLPTLIANAIAVGVLSIVNFVVSDRWVFTLPPSPQGFRLRARGAPARQAGVTGLVALVLFSPVDATAGPSRAALAAWDAYVARAEARLERPPGPPARTGAGAFVTEGTSTDVPDGTISDWHGAAFLPGISLDQLLYSLQHPGTPPPQEDVVSSRVVGRSANSLRVAIRLVRRSIVTVSYDTEHEMTFHRRTPALATARSVATRIEEVGGADHGFLWRLNSYWRYEQRDGGVLVELESLTLSRDVPSLLRPIASPLVRRVARESMARTLEALRRQYSSG